MPSIFRRRSQQEAEREWRRKSVKLREGEFLHGELRVEIQEARDLPDTDNFLCNIKRCLGQEKDVTDPYVAVFLDSTRIITTSVIYNNLCPQWNEYFRVTVCHHAKRLLFRVKDQDELGTDHVGEVCFDLHEFLHKKGSKIHGWQDILDAQGRHQGQLFLKVEYRPADNARSTAPTLGRACPDCYFPLRQGNRVTLFSCARNSDLALSIPRRGEAEGQQQQQPASNHSSGANSWKNGRQLQAEAKGNAYSPPSLWIDLYRGFVAAQRFIYITGWSVSTKIKLLRGDDWMKLKTQEEVDMADLTLGELLRKKAEQGVRVLLMIWGETTSIMGTHDTETENYFKGTRVFVARVARQTKTHEYKDLDAHLTANLGYSHHQKAVILDASCENGTGNRRIVAYVGGIDLTDGRYDTPSHPLFRSLRTTHVDDFYQPCEASRSVKASTGPRQPWQDIHAKIEGPAARDIMTNFVERWGKERPSNSRLLIQNVEPPEFDFSELSPGKGDNEAVVEDAVGGGGRAAWNVQLFRSITSDSARFRLENETSFTTKKGRSVDNSIARAYTAAIRSAERFIYIENQYFMGSAYGWIDDQDVHCYNVIPMEVTQKICDAIAVNKHFVVYIVIPMHPEGIPTDNAIQEMLFWQRHTMHMMYTRIAQALHAAGETEKSPTDYLMFFCLGKKERECDIPADLEGSRMGTRAAKLRKSRRYMIYVHSKLMIVDDEYVIVGSANINQRSLDGDRDTELAIGAFQESKPGEPEATDDVYRFRVALFREHLNRMEPVFSDPSSEECARLVREAAEKNWRDFEDKEAGEPEGHLLAYPVDINVAVDEDTSVVNLTAKTRNRRFPDTKAKILGKPAKSIPNKLTT